MRAKARSAIFFHDAAQQQAAEAALAARGARYVSVEACEETTWTDAEEWQQSYLAKQAATES